MELVESACHPSSMSVAATGLADVHPGRGVLIDRERDLASIENAGCLLVEPVKVRRRLVGQSANQRFVAGRVL